MTNTDTRNASPNLTRIIVATVISNGFVAYDFTVYGFSAAIIGRLFFPRTTPLRRCCFRSRHSARVS